MLITDDLCWTRLAPPAYAHGIAAELELVAAHCADGLTNAIFTHDYDGIYNLLTVIDKHLIRRNLVVPEKARIMLINAMLSCIEFHPMPSADFSWIPKLSSVLTPLLRPPYIPIFIDWKPMWRLLSKLAMRKRRSTHGHGTAIPALLSLIKAMKAYFDPMTAPAEILETARAYLNIHTSEFSFFFLLVQHMLPTRHTLSGLREFMATTQRVARGELPAQGMLKDYAERAAAGDAGWAATIPGFDVEGDYAAASEEELIAQFNHISRPFYTELVEELINVSTVHRAKVVYSKLFMFLRRIATHRHDVKISPLLVQSIFSTFFEKLIPLPTSIPRRWLEKQTVPIRDSYLDLPHWANVAQAVFQTVNESLPFANFVIFMIDEAQEEDDFILAIVLRLIDMIQPLYNPAETKKSNSLNLAQLSLSLCEGIALRVGFSDPASIRRYWENNDARMLVPSLSPKQIAIIGARLMPLLRQGLYSRNSKMILGSSRAIAAYAQLFPDLVLPTVIQLVDNGLRVTGEIHMMRAALQVLTLTSRYILDRSDTTVLRLDQYSRPSDYSTAVPLILSLVLPAIDINDLDKTSQALKVLLQLLVSIPLVLVEDSPRTLPAKRRKRSESAAPRSKAGKTRRKDLGEDSLFEKTSFEKALDNERIFEMANNVRPDGTRYDRANDRKLYDFFGPPLKDFVGQFLDKITDLFDNATKSSEAFMGLPYEYLLTLLRSFFGNMGPNLYHFSLMHVYKILLNRTFTHSRRCVALLLQMMSMRNPAEAIGVFVPHAIKKLVVDAKTGELAPFLEGQTTKHLMLISSVVRFAGAAFLPFAEPVLNVLRLIFEKLPEKDADKCSSSQKMHKAIFKAACKCARNVTRGLMFVYTTDYGCLPKHMLNDTSLSKRHIRQWGQTLHPHRSIRDDAMSEQGNDDWTISWHIPTADEAKVAAGYARLIQDVTQNPSNPKKFTLYAHREFIKIMSFFWPNSGAEANEYAYQNNSMHDSKKFCQVPIYDERLAALLGLSTRCTLEEATAQCHNMVSESEDICDGRIIRGLTKDRNALVFRNPLSRRHSFRWRFARISKPLGMVTDGLYPEGVAGSSAWPRVSGDGFDLSQGRVATPEAPVCDIPREELIDIIRSNGLILRSEMVIYFARQFSEIQPDDINQTRRLLKLLNYFINLKFGYSKIFLEITNEIPSLDLSGGFSWKRRRLFESRCWIVEFCENMHMKRTAAVADQSETMPEFSLLLQPLLSLSFSQHKPVRAAAISGLSLLLDSTVGLGKTVSEVAFYVGGIVLRQWQARNEDAEVVSPIETPSENMAVPFVQSPPPKAGDLHELQGLTDGVINIISCNVVVSYNLKMYERFKRLMDLLFPLSMLVTEEEVLAPIYDYFIFITASYTPDTPWCSHLSLAQILRKNCPERWSPQINKRLVEETGSLSLTTTYAALLQGTGLCGQWKPPHFMPAQERMSPLPGLVFKVQSPSLSCESEWISLLEFSEMKTPIIRYYRNQLLLLFADMTRMSLQVPKMWKIILVTVYFVQLFLISGYSFPPQTLTALIEVIRSGPPSSRSEAFMVLSSLLYVLRPVRGRIPGIPESLVPPGFAYERDVGVLGNRLMWDRVASDFSARWRQFLENGKDFSAFGDILREHNSIDLVLSSYLGFCALPSLPDTGTRAVKSQKIPVAAQYAPYGPAQDLPVGYTLGDSTGTPTDTLVPHDCFAAGRSEHDWSALPNREWKNGFSSPFWDCPFANEGGAEDVSAKQITSEEAKQELVRNIDAVQALLEWWTAVGISTNMFQHQSNDEEEYEISRARINAMKSLFQIAGVQILKEFFPLLRELTESPSARKIGVLSEVIIGISHAAKHFPLSDQLLVWAELTEICELFWDRLTGDALDIFTAAIEILVDQKDLRSSVWLCELVTQKVEEVFRAGGASDTQFGARVRSSRYLIAMQIFSCVAWRGSHYAIRVLQAANATENLVEPLDQTRSNLAMLLVCLVCGLALPAPLFSAEYFGGEQRPGLGRGEGFASAKRVVAESFGQQATWVLHEEAEKVCDRLAAQLNRWTTDPSLRIPGGEEGKDREFFLSASLSLQFFLVILSSGNAQVSILLHRRFLNPCLSLFSHPSEELSDKAGLSLTLACALPFSIETREVLVFKRLTMLLAANASGAEFDISLPTTPVSTQRVEQITASRHARLGVLSALKILSFNGVFALDIARVCEIGAIALDDPDIDIKQSARDFLALFVRLLSAEDRLEGIERFKRWSRSRDREQRLGGILGLSAFVLAYPYTIPPFVPDILCHLARCMRTRMLSIKQAIRATVGEFWRTHVDAWAEHKLSFTEAQLDILTDILASPSYAI
eukprot:gnl/Chilomastix_cuspidata/1395.p1 GENE.gnl/Chilomastix_cuspidata/1395~~gnl/Chilomastix_cuspidata/1395.p1  ORF type:complete len:2334 (+),score=579.94 gnl/Chilomastix_cuspidata/1395:798-7799(+)